MKTILFVCIHNSARSQMAEAYVNRYGAGCVRAYSAGIEPDRLNPAVVAAMREEGIDISGNATKSVADMLHSGIAFDHVVTVCDESSAARCPVFPGSGQREHWGFPDPSALDGSRDEQMRQTRAIRDAIKLKVMGWCATHLT